VPSIKCLKCGLVNFAEALECKRCGASLSETADSSVEISIDSQTSGRTASTLFYLEAVGAGLLICVGFVVYGVLRWPHEAGQSLFLITGLVYAAIGSWYGFRRRSREWLVALCVSVFYLLPTSYGLYSVYRYNQRYGHWFWTPKFYFSPVVLYLSIPVAAFVGARFGSKRSLLRFAVLVVLFGVVVLAIGYARGGSSSEPRQISYSSDVTAAPASDLVFRLDIKLGVQTTDDPMHFRKLPAGGGTEDGGFKVTVIKKDSTFAPTTQMIVSVDGKQLENTMWPINSADGSSHIDFSQKQDYSNIVNWKVGPNSDFLNSLVNAHHIELTWGNVNIVLPDEQVTSLRNFTRSWGKILKEEDMLCTNPLCVQGVLNH